MKCPDPFWLGNHDVIMDSYEEVEDKYGRAITLHICSECGAEQWEVTTGNGITEILDEVPEDPYIAASNGIGYIEAECIATMEIATEVSDIQTVLLCRKISDMIEAHRKEYS